MTRWTNLTESQIAAKSASNRASRSMGVKYSEKPSTVRQIKPQTNGSLYLTLPYPPSVNHYWRRNKGPGMHISDEGKAYQNEVIYACRGHDGVMGRVSVSVVANPPDRRKRDLDNIFKALLDSLNHAGMIEDDSMIERLLIERGKVFEHGQVKVIIRAYA